MENCTVISSISPTFLAINRNHSTSAKNACLKMWQRELSSSKISTFRAMSKPARTPRTETHAGANEAKPSERNRRPRRPFQNKVGPGFSICFSISGQIRKKRTPHYSSLFHVVPPNLCNNSCFGLSEHRSDSCSTGPRVSIPLRGALRCLWFQVDVVHGP